jgi:ADP-ribosylglycohydrolase
MNDLVVNGAYPEKVYAGVLGKIIGVYAGRPFEGWAYERILRELGEIDRYVADELKVPLVVADDDISGTFTFLRALADHGDSGDLTAKKIGETWLNYLVEDRTVLWWGGIGQSTEHTAYLRLKAGIPAPESGSIETNGKTVAEQIGAQIFIDGWGMIHPGDPKSAAEFARRAASVSHDGEAIYGAQIVAALVAQAFASSDINAMLTVAVALIPADSIIATMIGEIREWHRSGMDWKSAFSQLKERFGYDRYPGNCHIVPNHGVVILALLYGGGDFSRSLMIANTCGWDTDCNSGNVGCIVGILAGLEGIEDGYDWRGPIRDRMFLPTADGGRCVTDAVQESLEVVRTALTLHGHSYEKPKDGARFTFVFPGSRQGFDGVGLRCANDSGALDLVLTEGVGTASSPTFPSSAERSSPGYSVLASPTLSPGQTVRAEVVAGDSPISVAIQVVTLEQDDVVRRILSESKQVSPGQVERLEFCVPDLDGYPVTDIGIRLEGKVGAGARLNWLTWDGPPRVTLKKTTQGNAWKESWVNGVSSFTSWGKEPELIQNEGTGLAIYGCREWAGYSVEADLLPYLASEFGIAAHVQGLRRYYALMLSKSGTAKLVKCYGQLEVLAEVAFAWNLDERVRLKLVVQGPDIEGFANGSKLLAARDQEPLLTGGAVGLVIKEGRCGFGSVKIEPT